LGLQPRPEDWEAFAAKEGPAKAAQLALEQGYYRRAVEFYRRAGDWQGERQALKAYLAATSGQEVRWAWYRLAEVSRQLGDLVQAAQAWEKAEEYDMAAQDYYQAARKMEESLSLHAGQEDKARPLVDLYLRFLQLMGIDEKHLLDSSIDVLDDQRLKHARERVLALNRLPRLEIVEVKAESTFVEGKYNNLRISIVNSGYGRAKNVRVKIGEEGGGRFEVATGSETVLRVIPAGTPGGWEVQLLPQKDVVGEAVPLVIRWEWQDERGNFYQMKRSFPVEVRPFWAKRFGSTARNINIFEKEVQVGDRVEVRRGSGVSVWADEEEHQDVFRRKSESGEGDLSINIKNEIYCSGCGALLPQGSSVRFCPRCGKDLRHQEMK